MSTTRTSKPKLATLYKHLRHQAEDRGCDQAIDLFHGARLAIRVRDEVVTLTISRKEKPVGATELSTFRAHCQIPAQAQRWPATGQNTREADGVTWHYVAWRWSVDDEGAPDAAAEPIREHPPPKPDPNRTIYVCQICEEGGEFDTGAAFRAHALEVHRITADMTTGDTVRPDQV